MAPRTVWTYLSCHHQFAGAMAVAASNLTMSQLLHKYLYEPYGMRKVVLFVMAEFVEQSLDFFSPLCVAIFH